MLPGRLEIESHGRVVGEGGQSAVGGVEDSFQTLSYLPNLSLLVVRKSRINVNVRVGIGDRADGFGSVVVGPFDEILLRQAAF